MTSTRRIHLLALALCLAGCGHASVPRASVAQASATRAPTPAVAPGAADPAGTSYVVVRESSIIAVFGADKVTGEHRVGFEKFAGAVDLERPAESWLEVDVRSLVAESDLIARFIRSARFLDAERFPTARFRGEGVRKLPEPARFLLEGKLELHGVTKRITFPATIRKRDGALTLESDFLLDRRSFGIDPGGVLDALIDADVRVRFELFARPAAE